MTCYNPAMADRNELRAALLDERSRLTAVDVARASSEVAQRAIGLPAVAGATRVAAYRAVRGEVDCDVIMRWAHETGRRIYLPVTEAPRRMAFARWRPRDRLVKSRFGIDEPMPEARRVAPYRLDVVLVPLVAFDRRGNRLGHGAGYYDAAFAFRLHPRRTRPVLVGLAHAFQEVSHIDPREWDVPLDFVVTERAVIDCLTSSTKRRAGKAAPQTSA